MSEEIWQDIKGYEGLYQISNQGRVKSLKWYGGDKSKIMTPTSNGSGYLKILLSKGGIKKQYLIHRLVAEAFIPNPNQYEFVNHRDECKTNCNAENLEWCTKSYNSIYYLNYDPKRKKEYANRFHNSSPMIKHIARTHTYRVLQSDKSGNTIAIFENPTQASLETTIPLNGIISACKRNYNGQTKRHKATAYGYVWEQIEK